MNDQGRVPERELDSLRPSRRDNEHIVHRSYLKVVNSSNLPYVKASDEHRKYKANLKTQIEPGPKNGYEHLYVCKINPSFRPENVPKLYDKVREMMMDQELTRFFNETSPNSDVKQEKESKGSSQKDTFMTGVNIPSVSRVFPKTRASSAGSKTQMSRGGREKAKELKPEVNIEDLQIKTIYDLDRQKNKLNAMVPRSRKNTVIDNSNRAVMKIKNGSIMNRLFDDSNDRFFDQKDQTSIQNFIEEKLERENSKEKERRKRELGSQRKANGTGDEGLEKRRARSAAVSRKEEKIFSKETEMTSKHRKEFFRKAAIIRNPRKPWETVETEELEEEKQDAKFSHLMISLNNSKPMKNYVALEDFTEVMGGQKERAVAREQQRRERENPRNRIMKTIKDITGEVMTFPGQKAVPPSRINFSSRTFSRMNSFGTKKKKMGKSPPGSHKNSSIQEILDEEDESSSAKSFKLSVSGVSKHSKERDSPNRSLRGFSNKTKIRRSDTQNTQEISLYQDEPAHAGLQPILEFPATSQTTQRKPKKADWRKTFVEEDNKAQTQHVERCLEFYEKQKEISETYSDYMSALRRNRPQTMKLRMRIYSIDKIKSRKYTVDMLRREAEHERRNQFKKVKKDSEMYDKLLKFIEEADCEDVSRLEYLFDIMKYLKVLYEEGNSFEMVDMRNCAWFMEQCTTGKEVTMLEMNVLRILMGKLDLKSKDVEMECPRLMKLYQNIFEKGIG